MGEFFWIFDAFRWTGLRKESGKELGNGLGSAILDFTGPENRTLKRKFALARKGTIKGEFSPERI